MCVCMCVYAHLFWVCFLMHKLYICLSVCLFLPSPPHRHLSLSLSLPVHLSPYVCMYVCVCTFVLGLFFNAQTIHLFVCLSVSSFSPSSPPLSLSLSLSVHLSLPGYLISFMYMSVCKID